MKDLRSDRGVGEWVQTLGLERDAFASEIDLYAVSLLCYSQYRLVNNNFDQSDVLR